MRVQLRRTVRLTTFMFHREFSRVKQLSPEAFNDILKSEKRSGYQIVDVREPSELAVSRLPYSDVLNLPLTQADSWLADITTGKLLDSSKPTICLCQHGVRSFQVASYLAEKERFDEVYNVEGGLHRFLQEVPANSKD